MPIKPKMKTKLNNKKLKDLQNHLKNVSNAYTLAGLFSDSTNEDGLFLATIGAINDLGTSDGRIPERPWMRGWFDSNKDKIQKVMKKLSGQLLDQKINVQKALMLLGEWATNELKKEITNLRQPPNAPSTIRKKKSSNPLIDTGRMRNSVTHKEVLGSSSIPREGGSS